MKGERNLQRAGYVWHVFTYFPCNGGGVRIAIRKSLRGAVNFADRFRDLNHVEVSYKPVQLKH